MTNFQQEVQEGQRFEFGRNWRAFLLSLTDERIAIAENSLREMLDADDLRGKSFLDIGSGSGLFSLAARKLGAKVHSFDFDPMSVACAQELRSRFFPHDPQWAIDEGSILDQEYIKGLGAYDVVYSWGVLHHTGDMWAAMANAARLVAPSGKLYIAIYNNQGKRSELWRAVKKLYCSGAAGKGAVSVVFVPYFFTRTMIDSVRSGRNAFAEYRKNRGMSIVHDWFDWLGGLPFEVASVRQVFLFFRERGFALTNVRTTAGLGNNEFVFARPADQGGAG